MSDFIDTTEMYLRTLYELREEGVAPMRARIVDRLNLAGPTVSQTVARMQRDGLVNVGEEREVSFTVDGLNLAAGVMRRHRLAECMLTQVLGVGLDQAHVEACRWEHAMTDLVADKVENLLGAPEFSPYGNPIPGNTLLAAPAPSAFRVGRRPLAVAFKTETSLVNAEIVGLSESVQADKDQLDNLVSHGIVPGARAEALRGADGFYLTVDGGRTARVPLGLAGGVYLSAVAESE